MNEVQPTVIRVRSCGHCEGPAIRIFNRLDRNYYWTCLDCGEDVERFPISFRDVEVFARCLFAGEGEEL